MFQSNIENVCLNFMCSISNYKSSDPYAKETKLIHFMPLVSFYTPSKHQKTFGFLMFLGGIERGQWHEMG